MRCQCYKVDGTQCQYKAREGKKYCGVHKDCRRVSPKKSPRGKIDLKKSKVSHKKMDEYVILKLDLGTNNWVHVPIFDMVICTQSQAQYITNFIKKRPKYEILVGYYRQEDALKYTYEEIELTSSKPIQDLETARFCVKDTYKLLSYLGEELYEDPPENDDEWVKFADMVEEIRKFNL